MQLSNLQIISSQANTKSKIKKANYHVLFINATKSKMHNFNGFIKTELLPKRLVCVESY